jgi:hypothetical protein
MRSSSFRTVSGEAVPVAVSVALSISCALIR